MKIQPSSSSRSEGALGYIVLALFHPYYRSWTILAFLSLVDLYFIWALLIVGLF
jgi:hypothetical protein